MGLQNMLRMRVDSTEPMPSGELCDTSEASASVTVSGKMYMAMTATAAAAKVPTT